MNLNLFDNIGYIEHTFSDVELRPLKSEIDEIILSDRQYVWGNIETDFSLEKSKSYMNNLLHPICNEFERTFNYAAQIDILTSGLPLVLDRLWVNFQRKGEFLPVHNHNGIYSFAIWIKIPYNIVDEQNHESSRYSNTIGKNHNLAGNFQFLYNGSTGTIATKNIPVDKKCENKMILFPSSMYHTVYPFYTSDEDRISVSGNFKLKVPK